ncbi:GD22304 [Drosophila simulans]|uniref:GD22304 n=1 Tax=Drosophila simulans TaxID=7240 RepID=B4Q8P2_DROSI|nr:GD22304 [Drosophila simulans]
MRKSLLIVGSLLVTIFLAHLPVGLAVSCADDPTDTACVDCTDAANAAEADCVTTTAAPEATTAAAEATTAASADGETTTAAASGTDTTTASSGGKKRVKRTFKRKNIPHLASRIAGVAHPLDLPERGIVLRLGQSPFQRIVHLGIPLVQAVIEGATVGGQNGRGAWQTSVNFCATMPRTLNDASEWKWIRPACSKTFMAFC